MKKAQLLTLKRSIYALNSPYPPDDIIITYFDFLKMRDFIHYFQFNLTVFDNLLKLTIDLWKTEKRISRISLMDIVKKYSYTNIQSEPKKFHNDKLIELPEKTCYLIFELFKMTYECPEKLSALQVEEVQKISSILIKDLPLSAECELWLCENAEKGERVLNRLLRYPIKSKIISKWARANFENDHFRNRRAEMLGWILDEDSSFELEKDVLIRDFDYINAVDLAALKDYENELVGNDILQRELGNILPQRSLDSFSFLETPNKNGFNPILNYPTLNFKRRFYNFYNSKKLEKANNRDELIEQMTLDFYSNLRTTLAITKIWGIGYSRLSNDLKTELLKTQYNENTHRSLVKVANMNKNIKILEWILEEQ
jgi:hypothetical protein